MDRIPVFYTPRVVAANNPSISPSAGKPALVVDDWGRHQLPISLRTFAPASIDQLAAVHDPDYVDGVLRAELENGFGNTLQSVADAMPWQSGSMVAAALNALENGGGPWRKRSVACSPSSGFHHTHYARGGGFCTFNGLIVAAMAARAAGAERVAIIDFDYHYGDGTADIIGRLGLDWITHLAAGRNFTDPKQASGFIGRLPTRVKVAIHGSDLALYQAGADQHIDDPLGGLLTTEQMRLRDQCVFWTCHTYRVPVAWNLAGGYQRDERGGIKPVLDLHRQTMQACVDIYINGQDEPYK